MNDTAEALGQPVLKPADFKSKLKPIWCPGCGDYSVLMVITKALAALELRPENVAIISGIGCSSRIPAYSSCYGFHGVHGRALSAATGLKVARPELTVLCTGGDGDGFHRWQPFSPRCRRNVDITHRHGQRVYGMTRSASPQPTRTGTVC
jgi:2-oxoglutarate ferredoxin oxidoreductase subunit beta